MENTCFMNEVIAPRNKNNRTTNYSTVRSTYIRVKLSLKLETLLLSLCHGLSTYIRVFESSVEKTSTLYPPTSGSLKFHGVSFASRMCRGRSVLVKRKAKNPSVSAPHDQEARKTLARRTAAETEKGLDHTVFLTYRCQPDSKGQRYKVA